MSILEITPAGPLSEAESAAAGRPYLDWGAAAGGALVAVSISSIMTVFGSSVGLSMTSAFPGKGASATALAVATGLWVMWVAVSGFAAGGYFAGRMRRRIHDASESESHIRDGAHGLVVWATGILIAAYLISAPIAGAARSAVTAAGNAGAAGAMMSDMPLDIQALSTDRLLRPASPAAAASEETHREISRLISMSAAAGSISADDKSYLARLVAARTGASQQDAEKRVDVAMNDAMAAAAKARLAAEHARKIGILIAFLTAASLLVSAVAAWSAAALGGKHRDAQVELSHLTAWN